MDYTEQIHIRCTKQEKEILETVLNSLNENRFKKVGYRYILFNINVNEYLENNKNGLEIQINELIKEIEVDNEQINKIVEKRAEKEIKLNKLKSELNNNTLFNISNYKDNKPILEGFNRLKEIVIDPKNDINHFEDITDTIFKHMETSFNIKDMDLFKKIIKTHFKEWETEKIKTPIIETEKTYEQKLSSTITKLKRTFKVNPSKFNNDIKKCLEQNKEHYIKLCDTQNIKFEDLEKRIYNKAKFKE